MSSNPLVLPLVPSPSRVKRFAAPAFLASALAAYGGLFSTASAADCLNGYRTLGNQVVVACDADVGPTGSTALYRRSAPPATAVPTVTGAVPPRAGGSIMVEDIEDCRPGLYRTYYLEDGEVILAC